MKSLRIALVTVVVGALAAVVVPGARADACAEGPLACGADAAAAADLERIMTDHFHYGQAFEVTYGSPARTPGDVKHLGGMGDSALWTGVYLAGESYRYATARAKLATPLSSAAAAFWAGEKAQAKQRIDAMVAKYHLLVNIADGWHTTLAPSADPLSFGGGVVDGEPGMLMRACIPTDAPPQYQVGENKRVFGPFPWTDGKEYRCETAPSRDSYAGTTFGLLTAFDIVGPDDPALAASIRDDIVTLGNFLIKYAWNFPRPHGNVSVPPLGHDFDNFASPLFVQVPLARLNMTQAVRHVTSVLGPEDQALKWQAIWTEELLTQLPLLAGSMEVDATDPHNGYYKWNLHHLTFSSTIRLEQDPLVRQALRQAMSVMDRTTGDEVNAHFEAITYGITGEPARRDAAVTHLRQWRDYRARIAQGGKTDNQPQCGAAFECVPKDSLDLVFSTPAGEQTVTHPGTVTDLRARHPLPVALRPPTDFLWQRPPTQLSGETTADHEAPGIDYLFPYWYLRWLTEVAPPPLDPFPAWPGPAHA